MSVKICKIGLCLLLVLLLSSCGKTAILPREAVGEVLVGCSLPSGVVYTSDEAGRGMELTQEMLFRLFGDCAEIMSGVESCAIYLSARETVCEMGVFYCYAAGEARQVAELCLARGEELARYDDAIVSKVTLKGRYVLWAASEDPEPIVAALGRAVRG